MAKQPYETVVPKLKRLIKQHKWERRFQKALESAREQVRKNKIKTFPQIRRIDPKDLNTYYEYLEWLVRWVPEEVVVDGVSQRNVYNDLVNFYFILDQEPVAKLQQPIKPGPVDLKKYPLSKWIWDFAVGWGSFLDTTDSASGVPTFEEAPEFNWDEYMAPPSGYLTFNQFFARHVKPGMRPVAAPDDHSVIVAPGDCTFVGWWQINQRNEVIVKGLRWSIDELLEGTSYADRFKGGVFTHMFLNTFDYHRWHTPVQGRVLETNVVQALAYLDVGIDTDPVSGRKIITAYDGTGYQFLQTRGIAIIDSPIGLVACIPMGMAHVSSIVFTAEEGVTLQKGEELGYFQFGGSDWVIVFERASNVRLLGTSLLREWSNVHVQQGQAIGHAYPYRD
jgi:phosphatidylserine decarboxylase